MQPAIGFKPVHAEGTRTMHRWDGNPPRCPHKGEYYLSGAIVTAYRAGQDLGAPYFIAVPVPSEADVQAAIRDVRRAAAESRTLKVDSPLWKAIAHLCALTET